MSYPDADDVREGVVYGAEDELTGTLHTPAAGWQSYPHFPIGVKKPTPIEMEDSFILAAIDMFLRDK